MQLVVYILDDGPIADKASDILPKIDPQLFRDINFSVHILSDKGCFELSRLFTPCSSLNPSSPTGSREDAFKLVFLISERIPSLSSSSLIDNSVALDRFEAWQLKLKFEEDGAGADALKPEEPNVIRMSSPLALLGHCASLFR